MNDMEKLLKVLNDIENDNSNGKEALKESRKNNTCTCRNYDCSTCFPPVNEARKKNTLKEGIKVKVVNVGTGNILEMSTSGKFADVELEDGSTNTYHVSDLSVDEDEEGLESPFTRGEDNVADQFDFFKEDDLEFDDNEEFDADVDFELDFDNDEVEPDDKYSDIEFSMNRDSAKVADPEPEEVSDLVVSIIDMEEMLGMEPHDLDVLSSMPEEKIRALHNRLSQKADAQESINTESEDACPDCNAGEYIPEDGTLCQTCLGTGKLHENEMNKWISVIEQGMSK